MLCCLEVRTQLKNDSEIELEKHATKMESNLNILLLVMLEHIAAKLLLIIKRTSIL